MTTGKKQFTCLLIACGALVTTLSGNTPKSELNHYERKIVASCLVLEAASDGQEGMRAVLNVIFNRADRNVSQVLKEVLKPKQFSCFNSVTGRANPDFSRLIRRALHDPMFNEAYQLVMKMEQNELIDNTLGADHYHATTLEKDPYWAQAMRPTVTVGEHIFYSSNTLPMETVVAAVDLPEENNTTQ